MTPSFDHQHHNGLTNALSLLKHLVVFFDPALAQFLDQKDCANFIFAFRWLLCYFKRELEFDDCLRLWEAIWSHHFGPHFEILVAAAILIHERDTIFKVVKAFDDMVKFCNEISKHLQVEMMISRGAALYTLLDQEVSEGKGDPQKTAPLLPLLRKKEKEESSDKPKEVEKVS